MAMIGDNSRGVTKFLPSAAKFTLLVPVTRPAPTSAPVRPCVVEIGKPSRVARMTVVPAPNATARRNSGCAVSASGTSPLPENFFSNDCARKMAAMLPVPVVIVAHEIAVLYEQVRLPNNDATPLKLSLAPLEYARKQVTMKRNAIMVWLAGI